MLKVENLSAHYGRVQVLREISLELAPGEVLGLLGRNGAGKTTTIKAIMGLIRASAGRIVLDGTELTGQPAHKVPELGLAYVPQGRRLFGEMTVEENLRLGLMVKNGSRDLRDEILELFPVLTERLQQRAGSLSGGEQQMLATARALCLEPKVLLMDEPTEGLQPSMVGKILETAALLKARGVGVLIVEQKVEAALEIADRLAFIENGKIRETATPAEIQADPSALYRYVGVGLESAG